MYAPNVQMAQDLEDALQTRFESVGQKASQESWEPLLDAMVEVGARSEAVVAVDVTFAFELFRNARTLHIPYVEQVRGGVRASASDEDDSRRRLVDILIYGRHGERMNFAALSGDGQGIPGWGPVFLQLDIQAIGYRSTVIEENSYAFVRSRGLSEETLEDRMNLIAGYMSVWDSRQKLVASKLAPRLSKLSPPINHEETLIDPGSGRKDADYLEVNIFGPYNHQSIKNVRALGVYFKQPINALQFDALQEVVLEVLGRPIEVI